MKSCLCTGALLTALLLGCNNTPQINSAGTGGTVGGGAGAATGSGAGGTSGGSDAGTSVTIPDVGSAGGTSGGDGGGAMDERQCGLENFMLERLPPDLMLVLDRSSSMNDSPTPLMPVAGVTLWTETMGGMEQVVRETHTGVNWGLYLFPTGLNCGVAMAPEAALAAMNADNVINPSKTLGPVPQGLTLGTPTGLAMERATAYLRTVTTKNPKYIVMATDGRPTCAGGDAAAVAAVTAAVTAGFKTYVIGIAINAEAQTVLNDMAVAGGLARMDPTNKYYPVGNRADLVAALKTITGQVSNCVFPLTKPPPVPNNVKVTVSGAKVNEDAANGWSYGAGNMAIQFNGTACEMVKTNPGTVQITFGCPNEVIP